MARHGDNDEHKEARDLPDIIVGRLRLPDREPMKAWPSRSAIAFTCTLWPISMAAWL
jgi:hypothetical protein